MRTRSLPPPPVSSGQGRRRGCSCPVSGKSALSQLLVLPELDGDVWADIAGPQPSQERYPVLSLGGSTVGAPSAAPSLSRAGACTACTGPCPSCSPGAMTTSGAPIRVPLSGCQHKGPRTGPVSTPTCAFCRPGRAAAWNCPTGLARERGERHEYMYVTMLELGHLNL